MKIIHWDIPKDLKKEIDAHYRTSLAPSLASQDPISIVKNITFDGVAPNITIKDVKKFISYINNEFLQGGLSGVGVEVGAGCGAESAVLASFDSVDKIYGIEVCGGIVTELMPKVVKYILKNKEDKVIGCVGDFDNMDLPDDSVDFVFDFFSLHHSSDLKKTLLEINRVLKPGGFIFCFDKARDDSLTERELEDMLDKEYSKESKIMMGVNPDTRLTRRMNGEKEYRLKDWTEYFNSSNFSSFEHFNIARCASARFLVREAKKLFSFLPHTIQATIMNLILKKKRMPNLLSSQNRVYTTLIDNFPKEISLMIAYKYTQ